MESIFKITLLVKYNDRDKKKNVFEENKQNYYGTKLNYDIILLNERYYIKYILNIDFCHN